MKSTVTYRMHTVCYSKTQDGKPLMEPRQYANVYSESMFEPSNS